MKFLLIAVEIVVLAATCSYSENPMENDGLFEGDIVGVDPMDVLDRNGIVDDTKLWPGGIVYYEVDWQFRGFMDFLNEAIEEYHNKTCIRFRPLTHGVQDYIYVSHSRGCWSSVGRQGGEQEVSLGSGCQNKPTAVHELAHALGFYHEHSRSDRDDYLEIMWDNIKQMSEHNFMKLRTWDNNMLGEKFDYKSIMLYGEYTFSKDGKSMTMKPKVPGVVIGRINDKPGLSASDVKRINRLYECFGEVRPPPPVIPDYLCDFETDMCGMENQLNVRINWTRTEATLGGRHGHFLMIDVKTSSIRRVSVATPTFGSYGRKKGCFSFDGYFNGVGAVSLNVIVHEADSSIVILEHLDKSDQWKKFQFDVHLKGDTKFTIDAYSNKLKGDGTIAIDNVGYKLRACRE